MTNFCENFKGIAVSDNESALLVARLRCKQWDCEYCASKNRQIWRAHLLDYAVNNPAEWSFLTVTATSEAHKSGTTLEQICANWDKLMKRLKRAWGKFEYVRVYERHKSGEFHAHMLINILPEDCWSGRVWKTVKRGDRPRYFGTHYKTLKEACEDCDMGFMVDYTPLIDRREKRAFLPHHAVGYVTKYMTKSVGGGMPKGTRRIQTSRAISAPADTPVNEWRIKSGIYLDDVLKHSVVYDVSTKYTVTTDDFLDGLYIYPADLTD